MLDVSGRGSNFQLNDSLPSIANVPDHEQASGLCAHGQRRLLRGLDFRYRFSLGQQVRIPVQLARDGRLGDRLIATDYNNFAPRLGIA